MKIILSGIVFLSVICLSHAQDKLKVSVYYESLCPDCIDFFKYQLQPTYNVLSEYLDLDLVPFGKGTFKKNGNKWEFECQHGARECYGNAYHSCAVNITTTTKALTFATCTATQEDPASDKTLKLCAMIAGIPYDKLKACKESRGDDLLVANAERSKKVGYKNVPAVVFNDAYNAAYSRSATTNMKRLTCSFLNVIPPACKADAIDGVIKLREN